MSGGGFFGAVLGGIAGSLIPGLGWVAGAQWGMTLGSMVEGLRPINAGEVGRLADLRLSGSQYGSHLPRVWGRARVGGNIIWVKTDAEGNHLVERSERVSSGGGKKGGGASYTNVTYTATFAVAVCEAAYLLRDRDDALGGTIRHRAPTLRRIWFDDEIVYDSTSGSNKVAPVWHDGAMTQSADSTIAAAEGGTAAAHAGTAYFVVSDVQLSGYGNRLPNVSVEIATGTVTLADVVSDIMRSRGVAASEIDVSAATGVTVTGYVTQGRASAQDQIDQLLRAYQFDLVEIDGVLQLVPRDAAVAATIPMADLGAADGDTGDASRITFLAAHRDELPGRVEVTYFDSAADLQISTASAVRQSADVVNVQTITLPMALTATQARTLAQSELDRAWLECVTARFTVLPKWAWLAPGDRVDVETEIGTQRLRITSMLLTAGGAVEITAVRDAAAAVVQSVTGADGPATGGAPVIVPTTFVPWSNVSLDDAATSSPGFYVAATGATGWQGCTVYYSLDAGTTWLAGPTISRRCTFGVSTGALANGATAGALDVTNTVGVNLTSSAGVVENASASQTAAGRNLAILGGEVVTFEVASVTAPNTFTLSRIVRGLRRSPMTGHASGELFALSENAAWVALPESAVGTTVRVKCVSNYQTLDDVTHQTVVIAPRHLSQAEIEFNSVRDQVAYPVWLPSAVTIFNGTGTTAGWVTEDVTADVPVAARARALILEVRCSRVDESVERTAEARKMSGDIEHVIAYAPAQVSANNEDSHGSAQFMVEPRVSVSATTFQYRVTNGFDAGLRIRLVGYWGQGV
jgi:hypothetical protein